MQDSVWRSLERCEMQLAKLLKKHFKKVVKFLPALTSSLPLPRPDNAMGVVYKIQAARARQACKKTCELRKCVSSADFFPPLELHVRYQANNSLCSICYPNTKLDRRKVT